LRQQHQQPLSGSIAPKQPLYGQHAYMDQEQQAFYHHQQLAHQFDNASSEGVAAGSPDISLHQTHLLDNGPGRSGTSASVVPGSMSWQHQHRHATTTAVAAAASKELVERSLHKGQLPEQQQQQHVMDSLQPSILNGSSSSCGQEQQQQVSAAGPVTAEDMNMDEPVAIIGDDDVSGAQQQASEKLAPPASGACRAGYCTAACAHPKQSAGGT